jgi:hypothetical protein
MSLSPKLEELIWSGKARFETRAFSFQQYSILPVQDDSFIIVTGYDFQPAGIVNDTDLQENAYQGVQRIEFFDGFRYNHYLHKMSGAARPLQGTSVDHRHSLRPFHSVDNLYNIYKEDVGVCVSVMPDMRVTNDTIQLNLIRNKFRDSLNTAGDNREYTDFANVGSTFNNQPEFGQAYGGGPVANLDFTEFNFEDNVGGANVHNYNRGGSQNYSKDNDCPNMWYLIVKFVRVLESPTENIL